MRNVCLVYQEGVPVFQQGERVNARIYLDFGEWLCDDFSFSALTFGIELIKRSTGWQAEITQDHSHASLEEARPFRGQIVTIQRMLDEINAAILNGQPYNLAPYIQEWIRLDKHFGIFVIVPHIFLDAAPKNTRPSSVFKPNYVDDFSYGVNPNTMDDPDGPVSSQAQNDLWSFAVVSVILGFVLFNPAIISMWQGFISLPVQLVQGICVISILVTLVWGVVQRKRGKTMLGMEEGQEFSARAIWERRKKI